MRTVNLPQCLLHCYAAACHWSCQPFEIHLGGRAYHVHHGMWKSALKADAKLGRAESSNPYSSIASCSARTGAARSRLPVGHTGFCVWPHSDARVAELLSAHPTYSLVLLGHSLGAGVAALLHAHWLLNGRSDPFAEAPLAGKCYAFACPCVCDADLGAALAASVTSVVHTDDIVCRLGALILSVLSSLSTLTLRSMPCVPDLTLPPSDVSMIGFYRTLSPLQGSVRPKI